MSRTQRLRNYPQITINFNFLYIAKGKKVQEKNPKVNKRSTL